MKKMKKKQLWRGKGGCKRATPGRLSVARENNSHYDVKVIHMHLPNVEINKAQRNKRYRGLEKQWAVTETDLHAADKQLKCPAVTSSEPVFWDVAAGALDWWAENYNIWIWQRVLHIRVTGAWRKNDGKREMVVSRGRGTTFLEMLLDLVRITGAEIAEKLEQTFVRHTAPDWPQS